MPTYAFVCDMCGNHQEIICEVDMRDFAYPCTACGAELRRLFNPLPFKMKHGKSLNDAGEVIKDRE